jgi:glycosyltransferase EpsE
MATFDSSSKTPRVSIAVGIYNCAGTLVEAIDSIISQSYTDWELILCDDGSTDKTLQIAEAYAMRDSRIRVVRNTRNLGLNYSLNYCLAESRGEFYARMDGDDISTPTRIAKLVAALDSNPEAALVSSWMTCFDESGDWGLVKTKPSPAREDFAHGTPFCHAPCMVRTAVMRELGGYGTEPWLRRSQDYHLWFRLYAAGHRGINLQESLYRVRDDRNAVGRRSLKVRLIEARIMREGIRMLGLPCWMQLACVRPLATWTLPGWLYNWSRRRLRGNNLK